MKILLSYLKNYWKLVILALLLAAINQIFSMLDPWIFRIVIDDYATKFDHYTTEQFIRGVVVTSCSSSWCSICFPRCKKFPGLLCKCNYTKTWCAKIYSDGISHSLLLPFYQFEDQTKRNNFWNFTKSSD